MDNEMLQGTQLILAVETAVHDFAVMQEKHGAFMVAGDLDDLPLLCDQRARAFDRLQQSLTDVWQNEMVQQDMLLGAELQKKIGRILAQEKKLAALAADRRQEVSGQLAQLRTGKKAIAGYGGRSLMPKYFSSSL